MHSHVETLADSAAVKEESASQRPKNARKRLNGETPQNRAADSAEPAVTGTATEPTDGPRIKKTPKKLPRKKTKKGTPTKATQKKGIKAAAPTRTDDTVGPPFTLQYHWTPPAKSSAYLMGIINGDTSQTRRKKKFITSISVGKSLDFSTLMQGLLTEAKAGHFKTRGDAVRRRDELIGTTPAVIASAALPAPNEDEQAILAAFGG